MRLLKRHGKDIAISYVLVICCVIFILGNVHASQSSSSGDDNAWNLMKQIKLSRQPNKPRYSSGKHLTIPIQPSKQSRHAFGARKLEVGSEKNSVMPRQGGGWGWGWPSSYGGGGGGGYDVYTIIAVAAFAALFGALIFELGMGGSLRRSLDATSFNYNLPPITLGLDSERLPEVMVKIGDWISNSSWLDNIGNNSSTIRDLSNKIGVRKWFEAFKKDPVEYQCIRKLACETLASSSLAAKSLESSLGGVFLTVFGNYIDNGDQLRDLVKEVVKNPRKCEEMVVGGYCEEN